MSRYRRCSDRHIISTDVTSKIPIGDSEPVQFRVERATEHDVGLILRLIEGLAEYERLSHEVVATEAELRESLFGQRGPQDEDVDAGIAPAGGGVVRQAQACGRFAPGLHPGHPSLRQLGNDPVGDFLIK